MDILIVIYLALLGAVFGSFAMATVHRLRFRQLKNQKQLTKPEATELKRLNYIASSKKRSICLHCGYHLKWYDLIPIFSWLSLKGKCRRCKASIGIAELFAEFFLAVLFVLSYIFWTLAPLSNIILEILRFACWFILLVNLAILFIYDLKYQLLPTRLLTTCLCFGIIFLTLNIEGQFASINILSLLIAILLLSGLYFFLYVFSKGKLVGSGDYLLALPLAIILSTWQTAFFTLFLSNLLGCFVIAPAFFRKKLGLKHHIPFGPLLICAFIIIFFFQNSINNLF